MNVHPRRLTPRWLWIAAAVWISLCAAYIVAGMSITPFHGDESTLVFMSRDYAYQFLQGDLARIRYSDPPVSAQEQELRLLNGTVSKNLIGLAWHMAGFTIDDLNQQWDWGADWAYNQSTGHAPGEGLLTIARVTSAGLLALGAIPMFLLGYTVGGWIGGFAAAALYALNPALLVNGRRAMMEGSLTLFSLLTVCAGSWFLQRRSWMSALALGVSAGLALASKHTAAFTLIVVYGVCVGAAVIGLIRSSSRRQSIRSLGLILGAGLACIGVFLLLNPAWWSDPIRAAGEVLRLRSNLLEGQTAAFGGYANAADALGGFFRQTFGLHAQYYELPAWQGYIGDAIARYEASGLAGLRLGEWASPVLAILSAAGLVVLLRRERTEVSIRVLLIVWVIVMIGSVLLLTPLEWQRYYLPSILGVILLVSAAIAGVIRAMRRSIVNL